MIVLLIISTLTAYIVIPCPLEIEVVNKRITALFIATITVPIAVSVASFIIFDQHRLMDISNTLIGISFVDGNFDSFSCFLTQLCEGKMSARLQRTRDVYGNEVLLSMYIGYISGGFTFFLISPLIVTKLHIGGRQARDRNINISKSVRIIVSIFMISITFLFMFSMMQAEIWIETSEVNGKSYRVILLVSLTWAFATLFQWIAVELIRKCRTNEGT